MPPQPADRTIDAGGGGAVRLTEALGKREIREVFILEAAKDQLDRLIHTCGADYYHVLPCVTGHSE